MKEKYEEAELELIEIPDGDVLTNSPNETDEEEIVGG